ncbi:hypothetical protein E2C01_051909 [Portunus trituberculatus]|uniref:Secreted protein n=1 Tax=Portunus trituberculatus TaxID=210409 RepID=A0A5B7GKY0_PORTR|nr:hypothetical protein [Portunus trituberculatus]
MTLVFCFLVTLEVSWFHTTVGQPLNTKEAQSFRRIRIRSSKSQKHIILLELPIFSKVCLLFLCTCLISFICATTAAAAGVTF